MPVGDDTTAWRRWLPHLQKSGKSYFVTFCTGERVPLPPHERDLVLSTCVWGHCRQYWLHAAVVMPDHVHLVLTAYEDYGLSRIVQRIKSVSAHRIERRGIWHREYFDRILRSGEDLRQKAEYVCANPVRAGLVETVDDYPWIWRSWVEGERAPARPPALH